MTGNSGTDRLDVTEEAFLLFLCLRWKGNGIQIAASRGTATITSVSGKAAA